MMIRETLQQEFKQLFAFQDNKRPWAKPVLTTLCVGVPLLSSWGFGNIQGGLLACLSGLVILYLPSQGSFTNRITTLLVCSFGFMVAFTVGQFFSYSSTASVIAFGVFATIIHWIMLYYKASAPRSFFFIMIAAISISQPFNLETLPSKIGWIGLGTMFSCILALSYLFILSVRYKEELAEESVPILQQNPFADSWEAIIMGVFMALALLLGFIMQIENPYWIAVSCAAVMQGASLYHIWQRSFQRILGTCLGLVLCWGLLHSSQDLLVLSLYIIILQFIVELLVVRNYAVAVIFITPLAILLSETAGNSIQTPDALIRLRFMETFIGSILGAFGGWLLYREKLRFATIRGLQKISDDLKSS